MYKEGGQYKVQLWMRDEDGQEELIPDSAELQANAVEQKENQGDENDEERIPELEESSDEEGDPTSQQQIGVVSLDNDHLPEDDELLAEDEEDNKWSSLKTGGSFVEDSNGDF